MSSNNLLDQVKKLREVTGVGFKDCKNVIDETGGDIEKSIELLRKKGIAKANKRMERVAAEGLVCIYEKDGSFSMVEVNSETDFVAKNEEFIKFSEELSEISFLNSGQMDKVLNYPMKDKKIVKENLIDLTSKIGEKITIRRNIFFSGKKLLNFSYMHTPIKKNIGKLGVLLSLEVDSPEKSIVELGKQLSMHIAASSPISIDKDDLDQNILIKEKEIINEELKASGKNPKIVEKIAIGKINKYIEENTLLNQNWIMEPSKKVKDVIKEAGGKNKININQFVRFKVGEGL